ncbi:cupin domain-containing protein [Nocardioides guangzhouensis]|uniref:Cupin domain-containing protein n=1 Tax=Nocardioides guangzhouensis TaxID=2497878 RepID=A0A4Q4ZFS5_9ACTN|nr:cupin domain-containing protein [Nocardioides guangzhouensis]RYP86678.1 cupin domain-containing protein [Nocardioides guangzhouensis]
MTDHLVARRTALDWAPPPGPLAGSPGLEGWSVVDAATAAVHTGFGLSRLAPGGAVPAHVHSYEESLYVLDGQVVVQTPGEAARLGPGDYGLIPVGVPHSLRNDREAEARFARLSAPLPRPEHDLDTQLVPEVAQTVPVPADVRDPRTRRYGHIDAATMDPAQQTQDRLAVSASMRTALLVYSGISVKMMVDSDLGAVLSTMFMVQYEPDGLAGAHDHPFEETYLILEGAVEASFDGATYVLEPGDVAWAGCGCVHGFRNVGDGPVRWLETQAPQPPGRYSYRFARDWDYLRQQLGGDA